LQAPKNHVWTLWISIFSSGFGVAFSSGSLSSMLGFTVWGVWLGIATAVSSGWVLSPGVMWRVDDDRRLVETNLKAAVCHRGGTTT
jgi:hypothetical protein